MTAMPAEALGLPYGRPLTRADLELMPDDGHRYELIDGVLIVSAAPSPIHQRALGNLYHLLREACPQEWEVFFAPLAVALAEDTELQPDLLMAPVDAFTPRELPGAPILAVEVLSPSTRRIDLLLKKDRLREDACPHYWVVDPVVPSVTAWRLVGDAYIEVGHAEHDEQLVIDDPVQLRIRPQALIER
jgi:Uma2 family endonuclease